MPIKYSPALSSTPPPSGDPLYWIYELAIDTTGSGAAPKVTRLRVDGNINNIANQNIRPANFDCDLNAAAVAAGIVDNTTNGTISYQEFSDQTKNYFAVAANDGTLVIELLYDDDNGNLVYYTMQPRAVYAGQLACYNATDSTNAIIFWFHTAPIQTGNNYAMKGISWNAGVAGPISGNMADAVLGSIGGGALGMQGFKTGFTDPTVLPTYSWTGGGVGTGVFRQFPLNMTALDDDFGTIYIFMPRL